MEKHEFFIIVTKVISENPEWVGELHSAITEGLIMSLKTEIKDRHDAELALAIAYEYVDQKKLPEKHKEKIVKIIKDSGAFKGTEYAKSL